jgi:hypothetical protein
MEMEMETMVMAGTLPVLTPERLIFAPRLVEVGQSSLAAEVTDQVVFTVREFDETTRQDTANIFVHNTDTLSVKQLTRNAFGVKSLHPVLVSLDQTGREELDHILFLKQGKIHAIPLCGGDSYVLYGEGIGINSFKFFTDINKNSFLVCEMDVYPTMNPTETAAFDASQSSGKTLTSTGIVFDKLMVRYWDSWGVFRKRNHLFTIPIEIDGSGRYSANKSLLRDLMYGMETDCPGKSPGNGPEDYSISPDGRYICISCRAVTDTNTKQPQDTAWTTDTPIMLGELRPEHLFGNTPSAIAWKTISDQSLRAGNAQPVFSLDSQRVAFLSMHRAGFESDRYRISVFDLNTLKLSVLTEKFDISIQSIMWHNDKKEASLFVTGQYQGTTRLLHMHLSAECDSISSVFVLNGDESRSEPRIVSNYLYFQQASLLGPNELKRVSLDDHHFLQVFSEFKIDRELISSAGNEVVKSLDGSGSIVDIYCADPGTSNGDLLMPSLSQHYFQGANGDKVHCWYMEPVILQKDEYGSHSNVSADSLKASSVPLLVVIHGGPQSAMINNWNYRWNLATFASQGYGVLAINFHGSTSYGDAFTDSIHADWGGKPFEDILIGLDFILKRHEYLNSQQVAALGASYGGYMINWINGHTDRFKCLVNHDGVFSLFSQYYTTEELWFPG